MNVQAKEHLMTCNYYGKNGADSVAVRCAIYDDYSHQCYVELNKDVATEKNGNKESILNWDTRMGESAQLSGWTARQFVRTNHHCFEYLLFQRDWGYKIYGADTSSRRDEIYTQITDSKGTVLRLSSEDVYQEENEGDEEGENSSSSEDAPDYKVDTSTNINNICTQSSYRKPARFIGILLNFIRIIVPIVIIGFGAFDFYKAMTAQKDGAFSKALKNIAIRVVAGVFIFLLPGIVQFVIQMVTEWNQDGYQNAWCCCTDCILNSQCDVNACSSSCHIEGTDR